MYEIVDLFFEPDLNFLSMQNAFKLVRNFNILNSLQT